MDPSTLLLILLGVWVFILQTRIKDLDKIVRELREKSWQETSRYTIDSTAEASAPNMDTTEYPQDKTTSPAHETELSEAEIAISKYHEEQAATEASLAPPEPEASKVEYVAEETIAETVSIQQELETPVPEERYTPSEPKEPSWIVTMVKNYFTGGNLLVRIGGVVLFFGLAFLVKYIAEHSHVSMGVRLSSIAAVGVGFIVAGWRLRSREGAYGQILQGLGVAILYLVIYGAAKFYELLSLNAAFVMMLIVVIIGSLLASKQKSLPLMLFATVGGFMVPILTSSGNGSHVVLFSYYLLLNLGIFFMAWRHTWRILNLVGFVFTFIISIFWGVLRYSPELFATTEPFLIAFFVMYLMISILYVRNSENHFIDSSLLFGLPAVVFPIQVYLTSEIEYGGGYSAIAMGALYLTLSRVLRNKVSSTILTQSFFGLGVLFFTIAVPYFFDADVTGAIWSMEAAAAVWLSLKQERWLGRYFGEILLLISTIVYLQDTCCHDMTYSLYLGYMIVVGALFLAGYQLHRYRDKLDIDEYMPEVFLGLSFLVWMISVYSVATAYESYSLFHKLEIGFAIGTMLLYLADRFLTWDIIGKLLQLTLPIGAAMFMGSIDVYHHLNPFGGIGALAFWMFMIWQVYLLLHYDKKWNYTNYLHILSLWFGIGMLTLGARASAITHHASVATVYLATVTLPLLGAYLLLKAPIYRAKLQPYASVYKKIGAGGLVLFLGIWEVAALLLTTDGMSIPYIPIINLLDLAQMAVLYILYEWLKTYKPFPGLANALYLLSAALLSVIFARAMHHYRDIPYDPISLWDSLYFQTGLALIWSGLIWLSIRFAGKLNLPSLKFGSGVLVILLLLWEIYAFSHSSISPSSYIPILNLLEITQIIVILVSGYWLYHFKEEFTYKQRRIMYYAIAIITALLISTIFARIVHHYMGTPYTPHALWHSLYFQTGLSILWSTIAFILMFFSRKYSSRPLWFIAFGLLTLVVLKLFFVELASSGTIERIISFIVVGSLLLLIGYFVPLPPEENDTETNK